MDVGFVRTLFSSEGLWHLILLDQYDHRTIIDNGLDNPEIPGVHPRNRQIRSGQILLRKNLASVQVNKEIYREITKQDAIIMMTGKILQQLKNKGTQIKE